MFLQSRNSMCSALRGIMRRRGGSSCRLATSNCSSSSAMQPPAVCFIRGSMMTFLLPSRSGHSPLEPDVVIRHCPATRSRRGHRAGPVKLRSSHRRGSSRALFSSPVGAWSVCGSDRARVDRLPEGSRVPSPGLVPRVSLAPACCCPVDFPLVLEDLLLCYDMTKRCCLKGNQKAH